jgi:hypothetical protein
MPDSYPEDNSEEARAVDKYEMIDAPNDRATIIPLLIMEAVPVLAEEVIEINHPPFLWIVHCRQLVQNRLIRWKKMNKGMTHLHRHTSVKEGIKDAGSNERTDN